MSASLAKRSQVKRSQLKRVERSETSSLIITENKKGSSKRKTKITENDKDKLTPGSLLVDGKIVVSPDGELMVTKGAIDPVWYLPGIAKRFQVNETILRRALFEDTGGMYPELITRPDLKVFLPPIGNLSIYIFGNPAYLSDPTKKLTFRVHDECNGSVYKINIGRVWI